MKTEQAKRYFGSVKLVAEALGISTQAVYDWKGTVSKGSAGLLVAISNGELDLEIEDYRNDAGKIKKEKSTGNTHRT